MTIILVKKMTRFSTVINGPLAVELIMNGPAGLDDDGITVVSI